MLENFKIFGIGGCGSNIAHRAAQQSRMHAVCIDTDIVALENKEADCETLLVGKNRFDGLGTGGDVGTARMSAKDSQHEFRQLLADCSLAIVVAGIGGGTGSAITPIFLETAKSMSIPTMVFIVFPFAIEGSEKSKVASTAVRNISDAADIYCFFKNDELCGSVLSVANISLYDAMEEATDHIVSGITILWRMITKPGYINLDLATLLSCTKKGRGQFYLCKAEAYGEGRAQVAINELLTGSAGVSKPANEISHALVGICGGNDLKLTEISDTMSAFSMLLPPEAAISLGTVIEPASDGSIEIVSMLFKNWTDQTASMPLPANDIQKPAVSIGAIAERTSQVAAAKQTATQTNTTSPLCEPFRGTPGLVYNGENLDEPTYLRKRITIS